MSSKVGGVSPPPLYLNLSFNVNDDPDNVKQNRKIFFNSINVSEKYLAIQQQIHSNTVKIISDAGIYPDCDALITKEKNIFLTVSVADCIPIFLYDEANKIIALVHSGWKGTANNILTKTLELMSDKFDSQPRSIYAFIGPSASKCCYEVGEEVAKFFNEPFLTKKDDNKINLDLKQANFAQLISYNIPKDNIEVSKFCTICYPDLFHSYRRDGIKSGRMMGIIGMID
jgi:YfiH family protein